MGKEEVNVPTVVINGNVGNTDEFCYLMVEKKSEELAVPDGWDVIQMDDFSSHSIYPTLVGEMMNGFIKIFGKRPVDFDEDIHVISELQNSGAEDSEELKRVTLFNVLEEDFYMADMVRLLSSFQFDSTVVSAIATSICHPTDRTRWTWLTRIPVTYKTVESIIAGTLTVPVLEFWHFESSRTCWKNIALAFQNEKINVQKFILNDAMIDDSVIEYVAESIVAVRHVELTAFARESGGNMKYVWEVLGERLLEESVILESLALCQIDITNDTVEQISRCISNVKSVKLINIEMTKKQWAKFAIELNRSDKRLTCLHYEQLDDIDPAITRSFARTISAVDEIRLSDVKITADQWEEIGREIKQPHSMLKKISLYEMTFSNNEFAMFSRCVEDVPEVEFTELHLTRGQWGVIARKLSSPDIRTKKLLLTFSSPDKDSAFALNSMDGFKLIENGKTSVYQRN